MRGVKALKNEHGTDTTAAREKVLIWLRTSSSYTSNNHNAHVHTLDDLDGSVALRMLTQAEKSLSFA
jgi:hypothetical protein